MASESTPFLSPQEIEAIKRYVLLVLAAAVGALAGFFIGPNPTELTWANVSKAVAGAIIAALLKAWGSGRMDAARASIIGVELDAGRHPAEISELKTSDVAAVAIRRLWPTRDAIDLHGASGDAPRPVPRRAPR
jgi:hypothetical protein